MFRRLVPCVLCCLLVLPAAARAQPGAAAAAPDPQAWQVAEAIERLSSVDPVEREEATRILWTAGDAAAAALEEATRGDDVEVARRAAEILRNVRYGIRPDTPRVVLDMLALYRQQDRQSAEAAVAGLATRGTPGVRILTRFWQEESDPWRKTLLAQRLAERARTAAALLLADGSRDAVLPLLEAAAEASAAPGEQAMRDLAAFLLLSGGGGLDDRVARLKPLVAAARPPAADGAAVNQGPPVEAPGPNGPGPNAAGVAPPPLAAAAARSAVLLAHLCRARNDLSAARRAAEQSGDNALLEALLVETADWTAMADRFAARLGSGKAASVEDLGFATAYHRLAGDQDGARKWAALITAYAGRRPDDNWLAAEALILNDRPDEGLDVLLKHRSYAIAAELLAPRMQFKELFDLGDRAAREKSMEAARVEARVAAARHFLGDARAGREAVRRLMEVNEKDRDFELYVALAEAATAMKQPELADECAIRALGVVRPMDDLADLLGEAGLVPGERAARWWMLLRQKYKEPVRITYGRLRALMRGELPRAQLESLARAAAEGAARQPTGDRDAWLLDVGQTLVSLGHRDAAKAFFQRLNGAPAPPQPVPVAFVRLGDFEAEDGRWDAAATLYGRAWEMDRTRALPLLLRGNALTHVGRAREGRELIELAHLVPLADEAARHELMTELEKRKLDAEARCERELIVRTGAFSSWYLSDALRRAGDEAYEKQDYLAAAAMWDRAFLDNQSRATRFAEAWANFAMPALIHRARALGLMRAGDFAGATREADLAMRYAPGDADSVIAFVNELDKLGRKDDADELYRRYTAPYRAMCSAYPDSGQCHNQFAWAAAKSRRDLDDALAHARRAVELEPDNTASLDTLAEAHYQRGEYQLAIETINRCIEMEPKENRHAEQLERFAKSLRGETN